jgi:cytochrome c-type biogenesis protein CcmH
MKQGVIEGGPRIALRSIRATWLALMLLGIGSAMAEPPPAQYPQVPLTEAQETQYRTLLYTLRCLVCQNESLLDSDAPLAADLRQQVRERVAKGASDAEIKKYLTDRYGDFVLYKPPLQRNTLLLWGAPFTLAVVGFLSVVIYARRSHRRARPAVVDEEALQKLLKDTQVEEDR